MSMSFSFIQITSTFIALFIIIDIIGAIPILLGLKEKGVKIKPVSVSTVSFIILLVFYLPESGFSSFSMLIFSRLLWRVRWSYSFLPSKWCWMWKSTKTAVPKEVLRLFRLLFRLLRGPLLSPRCFHYVRHTMCKTSL